MCIFAMIGAALGMLTAFGVISWLEKQEAHRRAMEWEKFSKAYGEMVFMTHLEKVRGSRA